MRCVAILLVLLVAAFISPSAWGQKPTVYNMPTSKELLNAKRLRQWPHNHVQSSGMRFLMAFPNSHLNANDNSYTEILSLFLNNRGDAAVQVTITSNFAGFNTINLGIPARSTSIADIKPVTIQTNYGDVYLNSVIVETKTIQIVSTGPIQVIAANEHDDGYSGDAFTVLPVCQLGTTYKIFGDEAPVGSTRIYTIVATVDNTNVSYYDFSMNPPLRSMVLNTWQTLTYTTNQYYVSGLPITSSQPIGLFSGTVCGLGLQQAGYCSHMLAQMIDQSNWGQSFPFVNFAFQAVSEYTIIAGYDNTQFSQNGQILVTMNSNQYIRFNFNTSVITTSQPVGVMQVGQQVNSSLGDPFFMPTLSNNQFINVETQFVTAMESYSPATVVHFVRITTLNASIGMIDLNGQTIPATSYIRIAASDYYFYQQQIPAGVHRVTPRDASVRFAAHCYGYSPFNGYGFVAGYDLMASNGNC